MVGGAGGFVAASVTPWLGAVVFAAVIGLSFALAFRSEAITVVVPQPQARPALQGLSDNVGDGAGHDEDEGDEARQGIPALAMVELPGGSFWMGSADDDKQAGDDEKPLHEVELSGFACMVYPVTRRLYSEVTGRVHD